MPGEEGSRRSSNGASVPQPSKPGAGAGMPVEKEEGTGASLRDGGDAGTHDAAQQARPGPPSCKGAVTVWRHLAQGLAPDGAHGRTLAQPLLYGGAFPPSRSK